MSIFKSIKAALTDHLSKESALQRHTFDPNDIAVSGLPVEYDDTPCETYINGKFVRTVGEYKAEAAKFDRP